MNIKTLKDLYLAELQELRSVEEQLAEALPKMAQKAGDADLRDALDTHSAEPTVQQGHLDGLIDRHGAAPRAHHDQAMAALIDEAGKWADMIDDTALRDAALIASVQRIKHYEMSVYGTLATWAEHLGFDDDRQALQAILAEESDADAKLTDLATRKVNPNAG